jgi:hypothetical protein
VDANTDERGAVYAEPELVQISLEHTALNKCEYIKKINNNFIYIIQIVFINKKLESANLRDLLIRDFQEVSSNIVADICKVLIDVCFMENVDNGVMSDYFICRVAHLRNRRNYVNK